MLKRVIVGTAVAGAGWAAYAGLNRWKATWGVDALEATRPLPGDELVPIPNASDTRGITIDAPPELVWPWLVQMGYGRGGWYSIDRLDMRGGSADRVVPEWQDLGVLDILPTHPGGGFQVRALEPGRALVLYADPSLMNPAAGPASSPDETVPVGLAASGAFLSATPGDFAASWTFVLEPVARGRTRLIERMRYRGAPGNPLARVALSLLGFGVFVMMQRQMLGIRERAERLAIEQDLVRGPAAVTILGNGHARDAGSAVLAADPG